MNLTTITHACLLLVFSHIFTGSIGNCPPMSSPMLPPTPLASGMPHLPSPAWCTTPHSLAQSHQGYEQGSPAYAHYPPIFDWPSQPGQMPSPLANPPPIHPAPQPFVDQQSKMITMFPVSHNQSHNDFFIPQHTLNIPDRIQNS